MTWTVEDQRAYDRVYYREHEAKKKAQSHQWQSDHPMETALHKHSWYEKNRELVISSAKSWAKTHPAETNAKTRRRRARMLGATGTFTGSDFLRVVARQLGRCYYCGEVRKLEADHVIPISRGGSNDISNIVGACRSCNARKNRRTPAEWR